MISKGLKKINSLDFKKTIRIRIGKIIVNKDKKNFIINDVKPLYLAKKDDLTFFDSIKYKSDISKTKALVCITTNKLKNFIPNQIQTVIVKNVLFELALIIKKIYPKLKIGDCVIHHPEVIHGSAKNNSNKDRIGFVVSYRGKNSKIDNIRLKIHKQNLKNNLKTIYKNIQN